MIDNLIYKWINEKKNNVIKLLFFLSFFFFVKQLPTDKYFKTERVYIFLLIWESLINSSL